MSGKKRRRILQAACNQVEILRCGGCEPALSEGLSLSAHGFPNRQAHLKLHCELDNFRYALQSISPGKGLSISIANKTYTRPHQKVQQARIEALQAEIQELQNTLGYAF